MNTSINIAGITFKNPIMPASGTFGSGQEYSEFVDLNQLGAVVTKGVSLTPWEGNPAPRIMETSSGMINAVGLQNPGIDVFIERDIPFLQKFDTKIIVNVCGNSVSDYLQVVERLSETVVDMLEINISCPNVEHGGIAFGQEPKMVEYITSEIKPIALRMVYQVCHAVKIPVIGMGGIATINDVLEFIMAGATGVAIGTANFNNPFVMPEIISELSKYMEENNIETLDEVRGIVG
ncbi:DUF561 domain-containing protein [Dorea formicigenerans]|uniref:Dihydroorotate dehydrogenase B (NAD(+)), catalytic subunit n=1 Tax=Dorea formicigenerans TaxID=39486 RepID=A0A415UFV5_9FIRM|nr:DUF561 domain-containing protein [Dorea formicigenerans]RHN16925.1 DUF561 domain-containing protein [Dorea formicigenerans]